MPDASKVMRVSIVAVGSFGSFWEDEEGEKAFARSWAMDGAGQVVVMLSGKRGSSMTRTSEEGERRPRRAAEARSSCLRVGPRLSALPFFAIRLVSLASCILRVLRTAA